LASPRINLDMSVAEFADQMDEFGVVCLQDVLSADMLEAARAGVLNDIAVHGERDFIICDLGDDENNLAHDLVNDPRLLALCEGLTAARCPHANRNGQRLQSALRVLSGDERIETPMLFHYDASVVTIVVPIFIPDAGFGRSGELFAVKNHRPFRRHLSMHIVDKLATHNGPYRKRTVRRVLRQPHTHMVDLRPGNAYIFWGYRTFHGTLPCAPGELRATLILNYGEPHQDSRMLRLARCFSPARRQVRRMRVTASR
jgi:hypothetical protein